MPIYKPFGLIKIDAERIDATCNAYFKWKDLNTYISDNSHRGINMPDAISEPIGCYCFDLLWNRGEETGDATDDDGRRIEFKATSRWEGDLSSFGPTTTFDDLIFIRFKIADNIVYLYDLKMTSHDLDRLPINSTQTVGEQKAQGRRPHLSLYERFIKPTNRLPDIVFDIRRCKITEDNRGKI